jgi:MoxR-like ATPase
MDRFFMRVSMGYPTETEELQILSRTEHHNPLENITEAALHPEDILGLQKEVEAVFVSDAVKKYILQIVAATRQHEALTLGASPRGSIALYKASKANAYLSGRDFALPDDVKAMAESVLSHRLILSPKGKAQQGSASAIIAGVLANVPVPMDTQQ